MLNPVQSLSLNALSALGILNGRCRIAIRRRATYRQVFCAMIGRPIDDRHHNSPDEQLRL